MICNCYCRSCNPLQRHRYSENTPSNCWDSRLRGNEARGSVNKLVVLACPAICQTMNAKKIKYMAVSYCFYCTYCGKLSPFTKPEGTNSLAKVSLPPFLLPYQFPGLCAQLNSLFTSRPGYCVLKCNQSSLKIPYETASASITSELARVATATC